VKHTESESATPPNAKSGKKNDRDYGNLDPIPLANFLAIEDEPVTYRIDKLWRRNGRVVLAAQAKAGKTTLIGIMRSILDGDPFLGKYQTEPAAQGVVLLDFEMDDPTIRQWLRDQRIFNLNGATVRPLRGKASSFDILDPVIRSEWAVRIQGHDIVIVDCLRPILDALGLDENRDAGRFLTAFDELLNQADVSEALILHHMGHTGERSRGDSRIIGRPDATWKMFREDTEDEDSPRYSPPTAETSTAPKTNSTTTLSAADSHSQETVHANKRSR
jgi:RecA-family ATPase